MDILACAIGLVAYSYFSTCDPLEHPDVEQRLTSPNQVSHCPSLLPPLASLSYN